MAPLNATQQNAFDLINATLASWGITTLGADLKNLILKGDTQADTLTLALSQTDAYKQRFKANDIRKANGFTALTPGQIVASEDAIKQVMNAGGFPPGFYDTQDELNNFIGMNVSASEVQNRVQIAHDHYMNAPQTMKDLWSSYGFSKGDVIASILDPKVATQAILDRDQQVQIGGAAAKYGFQVDHNRAQQFNQQGVTATQANTGYQQIAQAFPVDQQIASRFGQQFGQQQEENAILLGDAGATKQLSVMHDEEQALFKGHAGATGSSLGTSQSY